MARTVEVGQVGRVQGAQRQVDWILGAARRAPLGEDELREHMTPELPAACGGPDGLNSGFAGLGRLTVDRTVVGRPDCSRRRWAQASSTTAGRWSSA